MNGRWFHAALMVALLALPMAESASGAATQPTNAAEEAVIRRSVATSAKNGNTGKATDTGFGAWRVTGALAVVLGLIFGAKWVGRRFFALEPAGGEGSAIRVLARCPVPPRQQVMLIQVGRRIVMVGNSGGQMNSLCEITDADEIALILGQVRQRQVAAAKSFGSLFSKASADFEAAGPAAPPADERPGAEVAATQRELGSLMEKIQALKSIGKRETREDVRK